MAGRKRHSAEEIVRKLRRADELAAAGASGEEIAAGLQSIQMREQDHERSEVRTPAT